MFSEIGTFNPTELFSLSHTIASLICFAIVFICVYLAKDFSEKETKKLVVGIAYAMFALLIIETIYDLCQNQSSIENIVQINVISIFAVSVLLSYSKNQKISHVFKSFVAYSGVGIGSVLLIFTFPSIMNFPIFHIKCLIELVCYSFMVFIGVSLFVRKEVEINAKTLGKALLVLAVFITDCLIINIVFNTNYLYLISPKTLGIEFLNTLYITCSGVYSLVAVMSYFVLEIALFALYKLFKLFVDSYNK